MWGVIDRALADSSHTVKVDGEDRRDELVTEITDSVMEALARQMV